MKSGLDGRSVTKIAGVAGAFDGFSLAVAGGALFYVSDVRSPPQSFHRLATDGSSDVVLFTFPASTPVGSLLAAGGALYLTAWSGSDGVNPPETSIERLPLDGGATRPSCFAVRRRTVRRSTCSRSPSTAAT